MIDFKSNNHAVVECQTCPSKCQSIFCDLEQEQMHSFNRNKSSLLFKKGQAIFNEGNHPLGIYCVSKGKIKVFQTGKEGRDQIIRLVKSGDVIGYRSLICNEKYTVSAVAIDDSEVCFFSKDAFFEALKSSDKLMLQIIKMLALDLRFAEQTITDLAQKSVRERLAEALLFLIEMYGMEPDEMTLDIVLSREEIANLVGTATETAIRILSEFRNDKILELDGKKIRIMNMDSLMRLANIKN